MGKLNRCVWKLSRCRTAASNDTILATRQEFFFTKVAPVQSITDIILFDFWLMLLSWMFISSYTAIYFFVKKFIFSNAYISVNTIVECLYMSFGWERGHQLSTYATDGEMGGHPKCVQLPREGGGVTTHMYVRTDMSFHGVPKLMSSIIWARKNDILFKSNYIQALK